MDLPIWVTHKSHIYRQFCFNRLSHFILIALCYFLKTKEENKFVLSLLVTEEVKLAIEAFFNHNDWDFIQIEQKNELLSAGEIQSTEGAAGSSHENTLNTLDVSDLSEDDSSESSDKRDDSLCQSCLCSPCVTTHEQAWLGRGARPDPKNTKSRKIRYKKFWTMLDSRGVWRKTKYLRRKKQLLQNDGLNESVVRIQREVMPDCVLDLVRYRYPNPSDQPYLGHCW